MMTREEAKEILQGSRITSFRPNGTARAKEALNMAIEALSADPVQGKWIMKHDGVIFKRTWGVCSRCGNTLDFDGLNAGRGDANFCPNCGANMR